MKLAISMLISTLVSVHLLTPDCSAAPQDAPRKPKLGLALSGGGARGAAHIGVLKVLEREGIQIDYIAGTSFGSLIGGFYALGYSPERIEQIFSSQNWDNLFSDSPDRRLSPLLQRKNFRYLGELSFENFSVELPAGLWGGQKLTEVLNYYTTTKSLLDADYDYDRLRIPFRAVATDLLTGRPHIFRNGSMAEALRASVAIPMMFTPVEKDNMLLVDGGLANNLPTDVVREMGADIVIAVDVTSSLLEKKQIHSFFDVMDQTLSLMMKQSVDANAKLADIVIRPELEGYTYSSYTSIESISARGEEAALHAKEDLLKLNGRSSSSAEGATGAFPATPLVESIGLQGITHMNPLHLLRELRMRPGKRLDTETVRQDLARLYATSLFDHVDYRLQKVREDHYTLTYEVKESALRKLGASIRYDGDYEFVGLAEINSRAMFGTPSTATLSSQFGGLDNHSATLRLIHPAFPFFFVEPMLQYRKLERLDIRDKKRIDQFDDTRVGGQLMLGGTFLKRFEVSFGYRFDRAKIGGGSEPNRQEDGRNLAGLRLQARRDSLDEQEYPHSGMLLDFQADNRSKTLGGDFSFNRVQGDVQRFFPLSQLSTLRLRFGGVYSRGDVPFYERHYIGGYNFSEMASRQLFGFSRDELAARQAGIAAASYRRQIFSRPLSFVKRGFLSVQYNLAAVSQSTRRPYDFSLYHGLGVGFFLDTLIGPMRFAAAVGEGGRGNFYLSLGPGF